MSWTTELYNLYDKIMLDDENAPLPIYHSTVNAQIEITITENGDFVTASRVENKEDAITVIPVTDDSGVRTSGAAPHPFADKLEYIAGDYSEYCQKDNKEKYDAYMEQLKCWAESDNVHPAVKALYTYLDKRGLITDLISRGVLTVDAYGKLTDDKISQITQADCFVRIVVNYGDTSKERRTWLDTTLYDSHIVYEAQRMGEKQLCYATASKTACTYKHPIKVLNAGSRAKLFSSNDESGFTYRGRFLDKEQAVSIGYEFSQKMHNSLKWLMQRQGIVIEGSLAVIAWESSLSDIPKIDEDTFSIFGAGFDDGELPDECFPQTIASYKNQLEKMIFGYKQELNESSKIMVLIIDSATTGRASVNMYSELMSSDFYNNLQKWHSDTAWKRYNGKAKRNYIGSFSVRQIADLAYGTEQGNFIKCKPEVKKEAYSRLLPCIIEGRKLPEDIVRSLVLKAARPLAYESYNWNSVLEMACGMLRKNKIDKGEECKMALDKECKERSYLYGRLIAVAEAAERSAYDSGETRTPNALRYFETFSNKPYQTWEVIYNRLTPYLNKMDEGKRRYYTKMIDEITNMFEHEEFKDNSKLAPEFLHAYSCQRSEIYTKKTEEE